MDLLPLQLSHLTGVVLLSPTVAGRVGLQPWSAQITCGADCVGGGAYRMPYVEFWRVAGAAVYMFLVQCLWVLWCTGAGVGCEGWLARLVGSGS